MTTISALLLNRGPDVVRLHGLRGRFFLSGSGVFYDMAQGAAAVMRGRHPQRALPADPFRQSVFAVECLARAFEDDGWEVTRRADSVLGFSVSARVWPEAFQPDPWDTVVVKRDERLRGEREAWDHAHGKNAGVRPDAKRAGGLARWRAAYETGEERAEREQGEAEATDR